MEDLPPVPRREVLWFRRAIVGVLVFCGVVAALASALCALVAWNELSVSLPARITGQDLHMLASGGAGFVVSLAAPAWVWWQLLPRSRRAGVFTMVMISWLLLGGIGAFEITALMSRR